MTGADVQKHRFDDERKGNRAGTVSLWDVTTKLSDYQSDLSSGNFFPPGRSW
jgi:hypothetical protein